MVETAVLVLLRSRVLSNVVHLVLGLIEVVGRFLLLVTLLEGGRIFFDRNHANFFHTSFFVFHF